MGGSHKKLMSEIHAQIDKLAEQKRPWVAQFIAHAVCSSHEDGLADSEHRDFWNYSGHKFVRSMVTKVVNERAGDKADRSNPQQITLPGFNRNHLQDYYIVQRNGRDEGIVVTDLTDNEISAKASLYRAMGQSCYEHSDELMRFQGWRNSQAKVAANG